MKVVRYSKRTRYMPLNIVPPKSPDLLTEVKMEIKHDSWVFHLREVLYTIVAVCGSAAVLHVVLNMVV